MSKPLPHISPEDLLTLHYTLAEEARDLMERKNHDYAEESGPSGAFGNLSMCEMMGMFSTEEGIVLRLSDKISRLSNVLRKGAHVKDETIRDTCLDLINYAVLLYAAQAFRSPHTQSGESYGAARLRVGTEGKNDADSRG